MWIDVNESKIKEIYWRIDEIIYALSHENQPEVVNVLYEIRRELAKMLDSGEDSFKEICGVCGKWKIVHDDPMAINHDDPEFICNECEEKREGVHVEHDELVYG